MTCRETRGNGQEAAPAAELDPTLARAYMGLGMTYQRLGRIEEAIAVYEQVLRIDPSNERAQQRLEQLFPSLEEDSQHPRCRSVGDVIAFLGCSVDTRSVEAGETVHMTLW